MNPGQPGRADRIARALEEALDPVALSVTDESERHRRHAGWRPGGETHFAIRIVSPRFAGMSRLARHRLVHAALGPELLGEIHALSLTLLAPDEV